MGEMKEAAEKLKAEKAAAKLAEEQRRQEAAAKLKAEKEAAKLAKEEEQKSRAAADAAHQPGENSQAGAPQSSFLSFLPDIEYLDERGEVVDWSDPFSK